MRKGLGCKPAQQVAPPLGCIPGLTRRPSPRRCHSPEERETVDRHPHCTGGNSGPGRANDLPKPYTKSWCSAPGLPLPPLPPTSGPAWGGAQKDWKSRAARVTDRNGLRGGGKFADPLRGCERQVLPVLPSPHAGSGLGLAVHLCESCSPRGCGRRGMGETPPIHPPPSDFAWPFAFQ